MAIVQAVTWYLRYPLRDRPGIGLSDRADDDSKEVSAVWMEAPCGTRPPGGSIVAISPDMKLT